MSLLPFFVLLQKTLILQSPTNYIEEGIINAPTLHQSIDERLEALQFLMAENQEKELILHVPLLD
jgi:hypothetical protein